MSQQIDETPHQLLTFILCNEMFALEISSVREVLDNVKITSVPQSPEHLCGVINLRGSVVPVIEMRKKFGLDNTTSDESCIIILEVEFDEELALVGALTDSVCEVIDLPASDIKPAPRIGTTLNTDYIYGMGSHNDQFITLLNINKIFSNTPHDSESSCPPTNNEQGNTDVAP